MKPKEGVAQSPTHFEAVIASRAETPTLFGPGGDSSLITGDLLRLLMQLRWTLRLRNRGLFAVRVIEFLRCAGFHDQRD